MLLKIANLVKGIIFGVFLYYINHLENINCFCSDEWRRYYIKYYSIFVILISILEVLSEVYLFQSLINLIVSIGGLLFLYAVVTYIQKLKEKKCKCSENWKRMALNIFAMIAIIAMILEFIVLIVIHLLSKSNLKK